MKLRPIKHEALTCLISRFHQSPAQVELDTLTTRMQCAEEFLKSLVAAALDEFGKGEWVAVVRAKLRDMP